MSEEAIGELFRNKTEFELEIKKYKHYDQEEEKEAEVNIEKEKDQVVEEKDLDFLMREVKIFY